MSIIATRNRILQTAHQQKRIAELETENARLAEDIAGLKSEISIYHTGITGLMQRINNNADAAETLDALNAILDDIDALRLRGAW